MTYVATGGCKFNFSNSILGSDAAILSSGGVELGRIRAIATGGLEIVVGGTVVPLKAAKNAEANR